MDETLNGSRFGQYRTPLSQSVKTQHPRLDFRIIYYYTPQMIIIDGPSQCHIKIFHGTCTIYDLLSRMLRRNNSKHGPQGCAVKVS